jgi:nucleoid DNA-binding protein
MLGDNGWKSLISLLDHWGPRSYTSPVRSLTPLFMTLTKRDLVVHISEDTGQIQQQVLDVVQRTLDYISEALVRGDKVELRNFGVFEVKVRKARIGRNPNEPDQDVPIPERLVVKFKAGKELRAAVMKIPPPAPSQATPSPS